MKPLVAVFSIVCTCSLIATAVAQGNGKGGGGTTPPPGPAEIAYANGWSVCVMDRNGGGQRVVVPSAGDSDLRPAWSTDGTKLLFNGGGSGTLQGMGVYSVNLDGTAVTKLTPLQGDYLGAPAMSPVPAADGQYKIAFVDEVTYEDGTGDALFVMNPDGSGRLHLHDDVDLLQTSPTWSPDGARIALWIIDMAITPTSQDTDILIFDLGLVGGQLAVVGEMRVGYPAGTPLASATDLLNPEFSRTSNLLALQAVMPYGGGTKSEVWFLDPFSSAAPQRMFSETGMQLEPSWSPNDSEVVFGRGGNKPAIYRYTRGSATAPVKLQSGGRCPAWKR